MRRNASRRSKLQRLLGVVAILIAISIYVRARPAMQENAQALQMRATQVVTVQSTSMELQGLKVQFVLTHNNVAYPTELHLVTSDDIIEAMNGKLTVYYDPNEPTNVSSTPTVRARTAYYVPLLKIGLVFVFYGIYLLLSSRKKARATTRTAAV